MRQSEDGWDISPQNHVYVRATTWKWFVSVTETSDELAETLNGANADNTHTTSQHAHIKPQNWCFQGKDTRPGFIHHSAAEFKGQWGGVGIGGQDGWGMWHQAEYVNTPERTKRLRWKKDGESVSEDRDASFFSYALMASLIAPSSWLNSGDLSQRNMEPFKLDISSHTHTHTQNKEMCLCVWC